MKSFVQKENDFRESFVYFLRKSFVERIFTLPGLDIKKRKEFYIKAILRCFPDNS